MKSSEIFALIVRCMGLALALGGIFQLYQAVIILVQPTIRGALMPLLMGVPTLLIGVWFLSGASGLVSFCYFHETKKP